MHDFSGSHWRHRRAQEHVTDVNELVETIRNERKIVLPPDSDAESGKDIVELSQAEMPNNDLAVRVGEAIYNFRAALDYAIYTMAGGKGKTQFPIENSSTYFEARKTGRLPNGIKVGAFLERIPARERDLIKAVQPYEGVHWTERVQTLSNRDKHREFVVVNAVSGQPFTREEFGALYPSQNLYPGGSLYPSSGYVEMHADSPIDIALSDGVLVTEALQEIEAEIGALLTALEGS